MKTTVVSGLLGAGKTTFIMNLISGRNEKTVVLVNDFGETGIDGEIFFADGIQSIELPSGCVCCTLKLDLIDAVKKIIRIFSPDHLIIEPSGIAAPSGILEALEHCKLQPATVIGIIDASEYIDLSTSGMYGHFFEDQIVNADIILINKVDLVEDKRIEETVRHIDKINPVSIKLFALKGKIQESLPDMKPGNRTFRHTGNHVHFDTISLRPTGKVDFSRMINFFEEMASGVHGHVVRSKALVETTEGPFRFDLSYGRSDRQKFGKPIEYNRLVIIGNDLSHNEIRKFFSSPYTNG